MSREASSRGPRRIRRRSPVLAANRRSAAAGRALALRVALVWLARVLLALPTGEVAVRGLTDHHRKLLTYLQISPGDFMRRAS